jgi:hypothetical protein
MIMEEKKEENNMAGNDSAEVILYLFGRYI